MALSRPHEGAGFSTGAKGTHRMGRIVTREVGTVEAGGRCLPLTLRCDPRARRLTLRVVGEGVRVTAPSTRHARAARRLAEARADWIAEQLAERPVAVPLTIGTVLPVHGAPRRIVRAERARAAARLEDHRIVVGGADAAAVARRVETLLRREATCWFQTESDRLAATLGLPPCPVSVRRMRSRWGSCGGGRIGYDWRLILGPPGVGHYVAAHEVAHRVHPDHSAAFWTQTEALMPDWRAPHDWLKRHGARLHAY